MEMSDYVVCTAVTAVGFFGGAMGAILFPMLVSLVVQPSFQAEAACLVVPGVLVAQIPTFVLRRLGARICDERGGNIPGAVGNGWILASFLASLFISGSFMAMVLVAIGGG